MPRLVHLVCGALLLLVLGAHPVRSSIEVVPNDTFFANPDPLNNGTQAAFWFEGVLVSLVNATIQLQNGTNALISAQYYYNDNGKQGFVPVVNMFMTYEVKGVVTPERIQFSPAGPFPYMCQQQRGFGPNFCAGGGVLQYWATEFALEVVPNAAGTATTSLSISGYDGGLNPGGTIIPLYFSCISPSPCSAITVPGIVTVNTYPPSCCSIWSPANCLLL